MDIIIRPAVETDISVLAELEKECFSLPHSEAQFYMEFQRETHAFFVAELQSVLLGYIGVTCIMDEGYIGNIAVFAQYRRKGIGDALLNALIEYSKEKCLCFLTLEVRSQNSSAIALYKKHDFQQVAVQKNAYSYPKDDAIIMTRYFDRLNVERSEVFISK